MELRRIPVDHTLREHIDYKDLSFPVELWTDIYNLFVDNTMNCHWHNEFEFGLVLSGELDYYISDTHLELKKGDCVFINSNTMHMATQRGDPGDAAIFTVAFSPSIFTGGTGGSIYHKYFQPVLNRSIPGFKIKNNVQGKQIRDTLEEVYNLCDADYGYELRCLSLLSQVWVTLLSYISEHGDTLVTVSQNKRHEEKAKDILTYIHAHYAENIRIDDITHHAGISRSECFRCFKRFTNKKPVEYINEYRLAHAAEMLKETGLTVAEVCTACGFSSSSYFGKLFKEKFGVSPLKFR